MSTSGIGTAVQRRAHIGASEIGAVVGTSPWMHPHELWLAKTGRVSERPIVGDAARWGHLLEPVVTEQSAAAIGHEVSLTQAVAWGYGLVPGDDPPVARSTLDAITVDSSGFRHILEVKTTRRGAWSDPPQNYVDQVLWQRACYLADPEHIAPLGDTDYIGCLHLGSDLRIYPVPADPDRTALLIAAAREFWAHVISDIAPDISDGDMGTGGLVGALRAQVVPEGRVTLGEQVLADVEALRVLRTAATSSRAYTAILESRILAALADGEVGVTSDGVTAVTARTQRGRESVDVGRLGAERPDVARQYTRRGAPYRVLRIVTPRILET